MTPDEIGRNLNVDAVLVSTLTRHGEALVLQTKLIDPADGKESWSRRYRLALGAEGHR
jgi:TolB-like protein